jgi:hypothetical protein
MTSKAGPIARTRTRPASTSEYKQIAVEAAYEEFPDLEGNVQQRPELEQVRVYRGGVAAESIDWASESEENLVIVIDGDLWCDGMLELTADQGEDSALTVYVRGNVSARDIAVQGDAQLAVAGDLEAERLVMCGGGNLGNITVERALRAGLVLEWTDGQINAAAGGAAAWGKQRHNIKIANANWIVPAEAIVAAFLDKAGEPDRLQLSKAVRAGESPFVN